MTKIKICGLTNLEDATVALEAGADMLGFIFYEPSPRYVSPERVRKIIQTLKTSAVSGQRSAVETKFAGVFVNASLETVRETLTFCNLDLSQLHGNESPAFLRQLNGRAFKALKPRSATEAKIKPFILHRSSFILLDAYHPNLPGGTGKTADWSIAAQVAKNHRLLLAGGLNPGNVAQAIEQVKPWGVDVSSGVEAAKGKKDHQKVRRFIEIVRAEDSLRR